MIFKYINVLVISLLAVFISACSSSSSTDDGSTSVTAVNMSATPSPANAAGVTAGSGSKTFVTADGQGNTVTLTKAYLVISSTTIETTCTSFSAALDGLLDVIFPQAHAHTTPTPTSTGVPYVINLLAADDTPVSIGSMSPAVADYCGVDVDLFAADADAINLPAGVPDMIGRTVFIEGTYSLGGGGGGNIKIDTGIALTNRNLLLSALMMISESTPTGSISLAINYDTWFDAVDLELLKNENVPPSDLASEGFKVLQNISSSIHQF